jgi:hypothetical protein
VALENRLVEGAKFHTDQTKAFVFKTRDNGANKATFNGIGLEEDEGAI